MIHAYVAVWIVAWATTNAGSVNAPESAVSVRGSGRVTKCCPRDQLLKIDLVTCEGYTEGDLSTSYTYNHESSTGDDNDIAEFTNITSTTTEEPVFSVTDSDLPWSVTDGFATVIKSQYVIRTTDKK